MTDEALAFLNNFAVVTENLAVSETFAGWDMSGVVAPLSGPGLHVTSSIVPKKKTALRLSKKKTERKGNSTKRVLRPCLVYPKIKNFLRFFIASNFAAHACMEY